jgi:hypothetical protein
MKLIRIKTCMAAIFLSTLSVTAHNPASEWRMEEHDSYRLHYQVAEPGEISTYRNLIQTGVENVEKFMKSEFNSSFEVYIHPNRLSIDQTWQQDWNYPEFKSECWMVTSGIANKMDLLSPGRWEDEACEHIASETEETGRLITHELFHVYHGQRNASPDFSELCGLDWFAEGFATYASGQCDPQRMGEVKKAIKNGNAPDALDNFWEGKLRYGLSGSVVMYIDQTFGRVKLADLLVFNQKTEVLESLGLTEEKLLEEWEAFIKNY